MKRFLTFTGAKRHPFDDGSDQSSLPSKFIGRCTAEFSTEGSWLTNKKATQKQLLKVVKSARVDEMTTLKDAPGIQPGSMGRGLFIKNPKGLYNPQRFFMLLENADYSFGNPRWTKYFPAFQSALDAHRDMHFLLGKYFKMHQKLQDSPEMSFVPGQLVLVKCNKELAEKSDARFAFEVRRGFIENVPIESGTTSYTVHLLDYGFSMEVTPKFLCPLPRPFDSIAPLAVQCSLYGVSPVGVKWCLQAREEFSSLLQKYSDHVVIVDVLSDYRLSPVSTIVNVEIFDFEARIIKGVRKTRIRFQINLTQFMIDSRKGVQWNLFPSRPKLMGGVTPSSPEPLYGPKKLPRVTISYRDALMIAPVTIPTVHERLPLVVISRELKKLFRLRHNHLCDVLGATNYLAYRVRDPDNVFCTPSTICSTTVDDE